MTGHSFCGDPEVLPCKDDRSFRKVIQFPNTILLPVIGGPTFPGQGITQKGLTEEGLAEGSLLVDPEALVTPAAGSPGTSSCT